MGSVQKQKGNVLKLYSVCTPALFVDFITQPSVSIKALVTLPPFFYNILTNVINTVLEPTSICPVERNISVPADFDIPSQDVSGFLKNNLNI